MVTAYVESNFPLELARQQEEAAAVESILCLAEAGTLRLAFPALAVYEPFSTLTYYGSDREKFIESMKRQLRELRRSAPYQVLAGTIQPVLSELANILRDEMNRLDSVVGRMLAAGDTLHLTPAVFAGAARVRKDVGLGPQDSIVYASVVSDAATRPDAEDACFLSRNSKDFKDPTSSPNWLRTVAGTPPPSAPDSLTFRAAGPDTRSGCRGWQ